MVTLKTDGTPTLSSLEGTPTNGTPTSTPKSALKMQDRDWKDPLRELHPSTACIHAGYRSRMSEYAIKAPVFRNSSFEFPSAAKGALYFSRAYATPDSDGKPPGLIYSRLNNPSVEIFEDKMVAAEVGASFCAALPSGMSAITTALLALVPMGGRVLYSDPVYGGTYFLLRTLAPQRFGVTSRPVDMSKLELLEEALKAEDGKVDMIFIETPANPTMTQTDLAGTAALRDRYCPKALICVDNTFLGPVFQRPFEHGSDVVVYSATKFIGGHSDLLAGVVLTKDETFHQAIVSFRTITGPVLAPDTAWMLTRSLETLYMRMERQAQKARKVVDALRRHPRVASIAHPSIQAEEGTPQERELCARQLLGYGSMFTVIITPPTRVAAFKVLDTLKVCHLAVSLGGTETLVQHPRSMTHADMPPDELDACGIGEGMIRCSMGLESSEDIINDWVQALDSI